MARLRRSSGAPRFPCNTAKTSRASSVGPIPAPTGLLPSVAMQRTFSPQAAPTLVKREASRSASPGVRTLAVSPTGMSITAWVEPAAIFLDSTEATSWPSPSRSSALSMRINRSSAGLRFIAPPQARQASVSLTTRRISFSPSLTLVSASMVSAVPAGEVMAREEVLGITKPAALTIDTTSGVVRLPGRPPTQCLSNTRSTPGQSSCCPQFTIAWVKATISSKPNLPPAQALRKQAISTSLYLCAEISETMRAISAGSKLCPNTFRRTRLKDSI